MLKALALRKVLKWGLLVLVTLLLLAQAVPYGRDHRRPAGSNEPPWDSARTRELAARACFDCHSNLTTWPWYSNVAPLSWLIQRDVDSGRDELNFSDWPRSGEEAEEVLEALLGDSMPPWYFTIMHPKAKLSRTEKAELARGFERTFGVKPETDD